MATYRKGQDFSKNEEINLGDYTISFDNIRKEENLRIVFMGTPSFAVPALKGLIENYEVVMVVCQPDRKKNRHGEVIYPEVKKVALEYEIPIYQPESIKDNYEKVLDCKPDMIVTCAYGQFIPKEIIDYPKYGCINIHGSLLPKYRGGAPIHWAMMNGDKETGITIMKTTLKMDAGDIIKQKSTFIKEDENLETLYERLSYLGRDLLLETIPTILNQTATYTKQDESKVTFALNVTKEEMKIDFNKKVIEVYNQIRGLSPIPGAYAFLEGKRVKIYQALITDKTFKGNPGKIVNIDEESIFVMCQDGAIKLIDIGIEGKKRCLVKDYLHGIHGKKLLGKVFNNEKE